MKSLNNPFVIGNYAGEHYFCDRVSESKELIDNILNGRNTVLVSHRRIGKTGLICHCFEQPEINKNYNVFFVDILATTSLQEFVLALGKEIIRTLKPKSKKFVDYFKNIFVSLRGGFKIDAQTGEPSFEIGLGDIESPETTLDEIFKYLGNADKPCVVAIDEFQQIGYYPEKNVEALLRTKIQHCPNCNFIFAGSEADVLINMFNSQDKPFYKSATFMEIGRIDIEKYIEFAIGLFAENKKKISESFVEKAYNSVDGVTLYVQFIMNELYQIVPQNGAVNDEIYDKALNILLDKQSFVYTNMFSDMTLRQKEVLMAMAMDEGGSEVMSSNFIDTYNLKSSSSVQSSLKGLITKKIVAKENGSYVISDRLFKLWLRRM
ncbi:MAG: ATP-binding protein [Bacteroidales bacterium]|nr:ATP-binding protein [Bacteroidales bacterium]